MSLFSLLGALEIGSIFSLWPGVLISFRILHFPDLTVDGFPLGGAVATLIAAGQAPSATLIATFAAPAGRRGWITGWLNVRLEDHGPAGQHPDDDRAVLGQPAHHGQPNMPLITEPDPVHACFSPSGCPTTSPRPLVLLVVGVIVAKVWRWTGSSATQRGLALRATGANGRMARGAGCEHRPR